MVFGGLDNAGLVVPNRTAILDLTATPPAWTSLAPSVTTPSARGGLSLSEDALRDRAVLFGGNNGSADPNDEPTCH